MGIFRKLLLWGSENRWMRGHVPDLPFVRRAVKRFMPGEELQDAIEAAKKLGEERIATVFTHLGENLNSLTEAEEVTRHYIKVLQKIEEEELETEISLKLTQLGLDLSFDQAYQNFIAIASQAKELNNFVWIDMEGRAYTEVTIAFYKKARAEFENTGLCLQAYLRRSGGDLENLLTTSAAIRLVKGAYNEPEEVAFPRKSTVDRSFITLSETMLNRLKEHSVRAAFATHDLELISEIQRTAEEKNVPHKKLEFQMLYGIRPAEQLRLAKAGYCVRVLISYGEAWYSWYMRRLAERPANVFFVLKNIFTP